jgi:ketosteroid isomerase-like protein
MSARNIEVIRQMVEAVVRGDRDGFVACVTPDVEWDDREGWPGVRRVYHGTAGVRKWLDVFAKVGGKIASAEIEEIAEGSGNRVLLGVFGTFRGRPAGHETEFNARAWYVFWLRDSKVSRAQLFWIRGQALEAAGLLDPGRAGPR